MVLSSELRQNEKETEDRQHRHRNIVHLWQFLLQLLRNDSCRAIISWSRKEHREFKLNNPEEVAKRWGIFKRNKAMTYKKLSRALRYYYQQGIIKKVPCQRFVYRLNKRLFNDAPAAGDRRSPQVKLEPPEGITGSSVANSFSPTTTPLWKRWSRPVVPMSYCPLCLCLRFPTPSSPSNDMRKEMIFQITGPSPNKLVATVATFPSATSIPVSVIQQTSC
ncbi:ETS translocation variant 3-like isoform X2 [Oculina patagonica]